MFYFILFFLILSLCQGSVPSSVEISLPSVITDIEDEYVCAYKQLTENIVFVTKFEVFDAENVHHMILSICKNIPTDTFTKRCLSPCTNSKTIFAWARHAPENHLPDDVGFQLNAFEYLSVQVHFKDVQSVPSNAGMRLFITQDVQKYMAGIIVAIGMESIRPGRENEYIDMSCDYTGKQTIYPFAFRTHTHALGRVVSGYQYNASFNLIGKSNPQWPQAFWPSTTQVAIKPGDKILARCTYNSMGLTHTVHMGETHKDEMCNFYIMYYYEFKGNTIDMNSCVGNRYVDLMKLYPAEGYSLLPKNLDLEMVGEGNKGVHDHKGNNVTDSSISSEDSESKCPEYKLVENWPDLKNTPLGQVSGVAIHPLGNIYIFHRYNVIWDEDSFDEDNHFMKIKDGPIVGDTVVEIDVNSGKFVRSFGAGFFYMPHGFHIDVQGNFWLTDAAMHQVFMFNPNTGKDSFSPTIVLGEKFVLGGDDNHFCKPTDVAVHSDGRFFVSDGYCNQRVVLFDKKGLFLESFTLKSTYVVHSISLDEANHVLYVADREHERILKLNYMTKIIEQIKSESFNPALYSLSYCPTQNILLCVNYGPGTKSVVSVIDASTNKVCSITATPKDDQIISPHDIAITLDGGFFYVAEFSVHGIRKFARDMMHRSVKKAGAVANILSQSLPKVEGEHPYSQDLEDAGSNNFDDRIRHEAENEHRLVLFGSLVIASLLVVPLLLVLVILMIVKGCRKGVKTRALSQRYEKLGEVTDGELKHLDSDSEVDEFTSSKIAPALT